MSWSDEKTHNQLIGRYTTSHGHMIYLYHITAGRELAACVATHLHNAVSLYSMSVLLVCSSNGRLQNQAPTV